MTKAFVRDSYGGAEVLRWEQVEPRAPEGTELVLDVLAASLNAADARMLRGTPAVMRLATGLRRPRNRRLGMAVVGRVRESGSGATRFRPGDRVLGDLSSGAFGAFAEQVVAREDHLVHVPKGLSDVDAAALPLGGVTALQALRNKGALKEGERVLVTGASGGVGSFAVQIAKASGAHVTAVTSTSHRAAVKSLGPDEVIDRHVEDFRRLVGSYDVVLETGGFGSVAAAMKTLKPGGRYVFVGGGDGELMAAMVRGRSMLATPNRDDLETLAGMVEAGVVQPLVGETSELLDLPAALRRFEARVTAGKTVLVA